MTNNRVVGVVLGWAALVTLGACQVEPEPSVGVRDDPNWVNRAVCDTINCSDPDKAIAACDAVWGNSSGKPYDLFSLCGPGSSGTNSDCMSDCFRNYCICGSTAGTPNACPRGSGTGAGPVSCTCATSGAPVWHRYWCCAGKSGTYQGWSTFPHCADMGAVKVIEKEPVAEEPLPEPVPVPNQDVVK